MRKYYSKELEEQYGVVGIELSEVYYITKWLPIDSPVLREALMKSDDITREC